MRNRKRFTALLMASIIAAAAVGCSSPNTGNSGKSSNQADSRSKEVTRISLYPADANLTSGIVSGWKKDFFAENGVEVEVWAYSEDKTNAILASGDLPDIMYVNDKNLDVMIESDMVLDLESYVDKMPNFMKIKGIDEVMEYMRKYKSADTGKLCAIPTRIGDDDKRRDTERNGLRLYWDYYEGIGAPAFHNPEELIPVLEQMQKAYPTDSDGNKTYGVGTYYDPVNLTYYIGYSALFGYSNEFIKQMVNANMTDGTISYLLEEDGIFYECLSWYNQLYKKGLLDPNSINYDRNTHQSYIKKGSGTYFLSLWESPGWEPYYYQAYFEGEKIYYQKESTYGNFPYLVINKNSKNIDTCLDFLDLLSDPNRTLILRDGPEGDFWEADDNMVANLTENALNSIKNTAGNKYVYKNGEEKELWNTNWIIHLGTETDYTDASGNKRVTRAEQWDEAQDILESNATFDAWKKTTGYNSWVELLEDKKALYTSSELMNLGRFTEQPSESQQLTINSLIGTINTAAWKMIYTDSDTEFNALWDEMIDKTEKLGAKEIYNWAVANLESAKEKRDSLNQ